MGSKELTNIDWNRADSVFFNFMTRQRLNCDGKDKSCSDVLLMIIIFVWIDRDPKYHFFSIQDVVDVAKNIFNREVTKERVALILGEMDTCSLINIDSSPEESLFSINPPFRFLRIHK